MDNATTIEKTVGHPIITRMLSEGCLQHGRTPEVRAVLEKTFREFVVWVVTATAGLVPPRPDITLPTWEDDFSDLVYALLLTNGLNEKHEDVHRRITEHLGESLVLPRRLWFTIIRLAVYASLVTALLLHDIDPTVLHEKV